MKKLIKYFLPVVVLFSTISCTDYVDNLNEDPDQLIDSDAKNLFQAVELGNQFFQTSSVTRTAMIWLNQANGEDRQYVALNNWNNSVAAEFDDSWNNAYVNCLTQSRLVQQKALAALNPRFAGAAQVLEANCVGTLTQLWGDIPYSQFNTDGSVLTPVFDKQIDVYAALQILLDKAIVNLSATTGTGISTSKDIYYGGDASRWKKLAYSLKARYYLHVKNYPAAKANAILGINSANDDFIAKFGNTIGQNFNPYYDFLTNRDSYMSGDSYAARLLDASTTQYRGNSKTIEEARFNFIYDTDGNYFAPYELNLYSSDFGYAYGTNNGRFGNDSNMPLVSYGEMLLIIAEADARTSFASGLSSYNNYRALLNTGYSIGVNNLGYGGLAYSYLPYVTADFAAGGMENPTTLTNTNALIREIYQERYVYFIGNFESFTDYGRTNNAAQIQLKPSISGSPQRFIYPQVEINSNAANVPSPLPNVNLKTTVNLIP